jgi:hypothetical protein
VKEILQDETKIAAIILIGFSAYHNHDNREDPWNEELTPQLLNIFKKDDIPMFMAVHEAQWAKHSEPYRELMSQMHDKNLCYVYDNVAEFMKTILDKPSPFHFDYEWEVKYFELIKRKYLSDKEYEFNYAKPT